uniref:BRI1 kinase inhibitor 1 n=1 Tax=Kalanchoe fedtschenkoi TaxID=63787 RepID=A0A7N0SXI9_KALFE
MYKDEKPKKRDLWRFLSTDSISPPTHITILYSILLSSPEKFFISHYLPHMAAATQPAPLPNPYNILEQSNNLKQIKTSRHGEQEEEEQEAFEYNHRADEPPQPSRGGSSRGSLSSSPSHEFSFTVCSLYTSPSPISSAAYYKNDVSRESSGLTHTSSISAAATAIDLSPADEIFFHGHLLPLHLLSGGHLSVSPRSSTNSLDSFTLPITSFSTLNPSNDSSSSSVDHSAQDRALDSSIDKPKSRSFSLFRNHATTAKSRKSPERQETYENMSSKPHHDNPTNQHHPKNTNLNKTKFDLSNAIKRYAKLVRPLLVFKPGSSNSITSRRESGVHQMTRGQTFSYSGNLSNKQRADHQVLRGRFSAPASMRTSPTNSGMFLEASARSNNSNSSSSCNSDSTMEELQAAIQAAIAHCKNSSIAAAAAAAKDKI